MGKLNVELNVEYSVWDIVFIKEYNYEYYIIGIITGIDYEVEKQNYSSYPVKITYNIKGTSLTKINNDFKSKDNIKEYKKISQYTITGKIDLEYVKMLSDLIADKKEKSEEIEWWLIWYFHYLKHLIKIL